MFGRLKELREFEGVTQEENSNLFKYFSFYICWLRKW